MIACIIAVTLGGAVYGFIGNGQGRELGRIVFAVGVFWLLSLLAHGGSLHF
jgi:hypothetical protein